MEMPTTTHREMEADSIHPLAFIPRERSALSELAGGGEEGGGVDQAGGAVHRFCLLA